jgi:hypothetical protein
VSVVVTSSNENYQGILDAINELRARNGESAQNNPPNYKGIINALQSLNKWGQVENGDTPPGYVPDYDSSGNITGSHYNPQPDNGRLWFDIRSGRLLIWQDDGWYQTNGADGLPFFATAAPGSEVPGALWFNTANLNLYIYDGSNWILVSSPTGATTTTALPLTSAESNLFPVPGNVQTQNQANTYFINAVTTLQTDVTTLETEPAAPISATAPSAATAGEFWFNSTTLELRVSYGGAWVPASLPLTDDTDFVALSNTVTNNYTTTTNLITASNVRITALENEPLRTLTLAVDTNEKSIVLNDSAATNTQVKFLGTNGIGIAVTATDITIDAAGVLTSASALIAATGWGTAITNLTTRTTTLETDVTALQNTPVVSVSAFNTLSNTVSGLPTTADLNLKVDKSSPAFTTDVDFNNNRLIQVGTATASTDGVNKAYADAIKTYADNTFITQTTSTLGNLIISRTNLSAPALDFSGSHTNSYEALKFKTYGGAGTVTFGVTTYTNEYAYTFTGDEEFSWIGASGKTAFIDDTGITTEALTIADISRNAGGTQVLSNTIDVKERISTYQTALIGVRTALNTSSDYASFKTAALTALANI